MATPSASRGPIRRHGRTALVIATLLPLFGGACGHDGEPSLTTSAVVVGRHATPRAGPPESLTVVSYNIQFGEDLPQALADLRGAGLADADIFLLQEMGPAGVDSLARVLACDYVYQPAGSIPFHDRAVGNAVLSRWPLVRHSAAILPAAERITGQRRVAVAAEVAFARTPVRLVSVHTAAPVSLLIDRLAQATAAAAVLDGDGPLVVGGDFNTITDHESNLLRRRLRELGLREARLPAASTMSRSVFGLVTLDFRLDHIYYAGLDFLGGGIGRDARASDHRPVWATFALPHRKDQTSRSDSSG